MALRLRRTFADLFSFEKAMTKRYGKDIPLFPMQREHEITIDNIDKVGEFLIFFLKKVVNTAFYDPEVQTFLNILPDKFGICPPIQAMESSSVSSRSESCREADTTRSHTASR
jgi:hypothetical protein